MYLNHIKKSKINYILYVFIWFLMCISRWEIIPISQWGAATAVGSSSGKSMAREQSQANTSQVKAPAGGQDKGKGPVVLLQLRLLAG